VFPQSHLHSQIDWPDFVLWQKLKTSSLPILEPDMSLKLGACFIVAVIKSPPARPATVVRKHNGRMASEPEVIEL
jgi:hypothetical protein